ncbi:MAG: hypothetical protein HPKKFMNG_00168 [Planctomycetes bacterium]|nr:hypothetical protein [Planctomycetota bacterium]HRJ78765.1 hypothetical protein [Planctomycetota bacterium]
MSIFLQLLPAALIGGVVMGVSQSRDFARGLLRGAVNSLLLVGGLVLLALLAALAENPQMLS